MSPYSGKGYYMSLTQTPNVLVYEYEVGLYVGSESFRVVKDTVTIPANTWTHLAATYDGVSLVLYMSTDVSVVAYMYRPIRRNGV
eukprot:1190433-Prorocentrum_minimum.AAC.1